VVTDRRLVISIATAVLLAAACATDEAADTKAAPPAKIDAPVKEAALATVTLTPAAEARLGIKTAAVERKALLRTRTIGGEVIAPPGAESLVTAPFAGRLEAPTGVPVAGTAVTKGRAIFRLVPLAPSERDARVDAARAVGEAPARQDAAAKKTRRAQQLAVDGAGSRRAVEEAQAESAIADADLKAARDRLALADRGNIGGVDNGGITLEAPATGVIRNVQASVGQTVAAGSPLFDIVRLDTVWVRVPMYVGESDEIDPLAPARIVGLGDPADAEGLLARPVPAPPSADASTAAVDLYFALSNPGPTLRPGQRVGVRLTRRGETDSLVVPRAALLHDAYGGAWVYEAGSEHVYVRRRVNVSDLVDAYVVLSQGPAPGVRVVTDGAAELFGTEFGAGK
jgi:RND family efflux transporter MFP subunit